MCKERSQRQTSKHDPCLCFEETASNLEQSELLRAGYQWVHEWLQSIYSASHTLKTFHEGAVCYSQGMETVENYSGSSLMSVMMSSMESPPSQSVCCKL